MCVFYRVSRYWYHISHAWLSYLGLASERRNASYLSSWGTVPRASPPAGGTNGAADAGHAQPRSPRQSATRALLGRRGSSGAIGSGACCHTPVGWRGEAEAAAAEAEAEAAAAAARVARRCALAGRAPGV